MSTSTRSTEYDFSAFVADCRELFPNKADFKREVGFGRDICRRLHLKKQPPNIIRKTLREVMLDLRHNR